METKPMTNVNDQPIQENKETSSRRRPQFQSGSGVLFENKKKRDDQDPSYIGKCMINGVRFWISADIKKNDIGEFYSLVFRKASRSQQPYFNNNNYRPRKVSPPVNETSKQA